MSGRWVSCFNPTYVHLISYIFTPLPPHLQRQRKAIREVVIASTRHILTTTLTTVTGFVPLFLYGGAFWEPLAICISIGVIGTTLSALVFVPSGWYYLAQAQKVSPLSVSE